MVHISSMNANKDINLLNVLASAAIIKNCNDKDCDKISNKLIDSINNNNNEVLNDLPLSTMPEGLQNKTAMVIQNSTQLVLPSENGKTMTVLQIDKQVADHSYAFICELNRARQDEFENSSCSSMDMDYESVCKSSEADASEFVQTEEVVDSQCIAIPPHGAAAAEGFTDILSPGAAQPSEEDNEFVLSPGAASHDFTGTIETSTVNMEPSDYALTDCLASESVAESCVVSNEAVSVKVEPGTNSNNLVSNSSQSFPVVKQESIKVEPSTNDIKPVVPIIKQESININTKPIMSVKKHIADITSVNNLLKGTLPQSTTLKALEGKVVTLSVHNKPQHFLVAHKGSLKNKYIIEDDLSPVVKFGKQVTKTPASVPNSIQIISTLNTSHNSSNEVPLYSTAGNLLEVLPLSDAGDKPVQFVSVSGESSGEESPAVILPPPLVVPDEDSSRSATPLPNDKMVNGDPLPLHATSLSTISSSDPPKINLRIGPHAIVKGQSNSGTPFKLDTPISIGSSIGSLSWNNLSKAVTPPVIHPDISNSSQNVNTVYKPNIQLSDSLNGSMTDSFISTVDCVEETASSVSLPSSPVSTSRCTAYVRKRRVQALPTKPSNQIHPLVEHDYCSFKNFNAQVQSSILLMADGSSKNEKKYVKKSKGLKPNKIKNGISEKNDKYDVPVTKPGRGRPKKKLDMFVNSFSESNKEAKKKFLVKKPVSTEGHKIKDVSARRSKRDDKSFVKITGSFQDDFVYYTTKNKRRLRKDSGSKSLSDLIPQSMPHKPSMSAGATPAGANMFDWYRDLSKLDKNSRFGVPEPSITPPLNHDDDSCSSTATEPASTMEGPANDSEMVDLVCELSAISSNTEPPVAGTPDELHSMAEQVRSMINNMDHNDINDVLNSTVFDNVLPLPNGTSTLPESTLPAVPLGDLDDISDKDLLYNNVPAITSIISDLVATTTTTSIPAVTPTTVVTDSAPLTPAIINQTAPELTVVHMYWNDLPGLIINSHQYVRLVDIHKQVLPAKDTGILKKRCQMMDLLVSNCSELQRDFLIRYANAAKSKSTVIVEKESAKILISFYVEPRARLPYSRGDLESDAVSSDLVIDPMANTANHMSITTQNDSVIVDDECTENGKRSSRLRHKAGKYVEMLQGNVNWNSGAEPTTIKRSSSVSKYIDVETESDVEDHENKDLDHHGSLVAIKKIMDRSRVHPLSKRDKRRLRWLRARVHNKKNGVVKDKRSKASSQGSVKSKLQDTHQHRVDGKVNRSNKPLKVLNIMHRDNCSRNSQRGRSQQGILYMKLQKVKDSLCVECAMCKEMFSLKKFMNHQHPPCRPDELVEVTLPQRLELSNPTPTSVESDQWLSFKEKQKDLQNRRSEKQSQTKDVAKSVKSESINVDLNDSGVVCEQFPSEVLPDKIPLTSTPNAKSKMHDSSTIKENISSLVQDGDIRQSTRVRKRKQMDEFVYNSTSTSPNGDVAPPTKRSRRSGSHRPEENNTTIAHIDDQTIFIQRPTRRSRGSNSRSSFSAFD